MNNIEEFFFKYETLEEIKPEIKNYKQSEIIKELLSLSEYNDKAGYIEYYSFLYNQLNDDSKAILKLI